ncbi:MAG: hypothetical protein NTU72_08985 [Fimbriimonadales bacterium]|nr:hypothetical protein [Fimbriimonadales bacterium]
MNPVRKGLCSDKIEYRWSATRAVRLDKKGAIEGDTSLGHGRKDVH